MRGDFLCQCCIVACLLLFGGGLKGQTTIFNETFNEANGSTNGVDQFGSTWVASCPTCEGYYSVQNNELEQNNSGRFPGSNTLPLFRTSAMDISRCNTLTLRMSYQGGNYGTVFESEVECSMALPCNGDPDDPFDGGCNNCWDFFLAELVYNDGTRERARFIGANGDLPGSANIDYSTSCLNQKTDVSIEVRSQTWANDEFINLDNVVLICNDIPSTLVVDEVPDGQPIFCVGQQVELEVRSPGSGTYEWFDPNDNSIGGGTSISFSASLIFGASQTFTVIRTDPSGCKFLGSYTLLIRTAPSISITPDNITVCQGEDVTLMGNSNNANMWSWLSPSGNSTTGNTNSVTYGNLMPSSSGTYSVTVTNADGCSATDNTTITVEPGGNYSLMSIPDQCTDGSAISLSTTQDGINGDWTGSGITANTFSPSSVVSGNYELTFTPSSGGCATPMTTSVTVADSPTSFQPSSNFQSCGSGTTEFDLTLFDNEINGGSGDPVTWYEDANQMNEIADPTNFTSGNNTVYAIIMANGCVSNERTLDLLVADGPEIMTSGSLVGCGDVTLNAMTILNESGNQAYYDMPNGMGNQIPVGTIFTTDTVIYAFDSNLGCSDEQEIVVTVGMPTDAGPDITVDTCFMGRLALQDLVPAGTDPGFFTDGVGNPIIQDTLDIAMLGLSQIILNYQTNAISPCPSDEATYTLNILLANQAGPDASTTICTGETVDINTLTFDNGANGVFEFADGTPSPQTTFTMLPGDQDFQLDFNYIVRRGSSCPPDTAFIAVAGLQSKITSIDDEVCSDFELEVFGVIYDINNPMGSEMGSSQSGCDSIVNIDLQFRPENTTLVNSVLCTGNQIIVNNVIYDETNPIGTEILFQADRFGCDSIINIDLSFDNEVRTSIAFELCDGQDTLINNTLYNSSNTTGSVTLFSSSGCDSIVEVDLTFNNSSESTITGIFCPEDSVIVEGEIFDINRQNGSVVSDSLNSQGCDSMIVIDMQFDLSFSQEVVMDLCSDQQVIINGAIYDANRPRGFETINNPSGCDSVYLIDLNILQADTLFLDETFCSDTTIMVNGVGYNQANPIGEEVIIEASTSGCNQYVFIDLAFENAKENLIDSVLCPDETIMVNGVEYGITNPLGMERIRLDNGCDSIVTIDLSFTGLLTSISASTPDCEGDGSVEVTIDISEGEEFLEDILLDGNSVLSNYELDGLISGVNPGMHFIEFIDSRGCIIGYPFSIDDINNKSLSIVSEVIEDRYYLLSIEFDGVIESIQWSPSEDLSCVNCPETEARPVGNSTIFLEIIDENGCTQVDSLTLNFLSASFLYQPNVFSPNQDGINDIFYIEADGVFTFRNFSIFDRWGNRVHNENNGTTGDPGFGWDGGDAQSGVYIYYLEIEFPDGTQTITGEVSLIR